jgi:hypothetical protein
LNDRNTDVDANASFGNEHERFSSDTVNQKFPEDINADSADIKRKTTLSYTNPQKKEDAELIVGGPLWCYLDRMANYNGSLLTLFSECGHYKTL